MTIIYLYLQSVNDILEGMGSYKLRISKLKYHIISNAATTLELLSIPSTSPGPARHGCVVAVDILSWIQHHIQHWCHCHYFGHTEETLSNLPKLYYLSYVGPPSTYRCHNEAKNVTE